MEDSGQVSPASASPESSYFASPPVLDEVDPRALTRLNLFVKFYKTKMCPFYKKKRCEWGSECKFAHGRKELRSGPDLSKTRMCPSLQRRGRCEKGTACRFAHNHEELRATSDLYKTSLCYQWMLGNCLSSTTWCRKAQGKDEQLNAIRSCLANVDKPAAPPANALNTAQEGTGTLFKPVSSVPEDTKLFCPAGAPPAHSGDNDEVELCVRFRIPRGAVARLNNLQGQEHLISPREEPQTGGRRVESRDELPATLQRMMISPDAACRTPDYPARDVSPFGMAAALLPQGPLDTGIMPRGPQVQSPPDILPSELLPKFLSATLDVPPLFSEREAEERETASTSSAVSSPDFMLDFPSFSLLNALASDHDFSFLPSRTSQW